MTFPPKNTHDRETLVERECHGSARGEALRNQKQITPVESDNGFSLRTEPAL
jgi:hypothetical protein